MNPDAFDQNYINFIDYCGVCPAEIVCECFYSANFLASHSLMVQQFFNNGGHYDMDFQCDISQCALHFRDYNRYIQTLLFFLTLHSCYNLCIVSLSDIV